MRATHSGGLRPSAKLRATLSLSSLDPFGKLRVDGEPRRTVDRARDDPELVEGSKGGNEAGFTLLEIMVVVALMGTLAAMAIMVSPSFTQHARADAGISQVMDAMRSAREVAISQRRNVELRFVVANAVQTARVDIGANGAETGTTILRTVELENRMQFRLEQGVPDTPDLFGAGAAIAFGPSPRRMFTSEGTFVDANGDVLNGTVFLSIPNQPNSARAITVMGTTALLRGWRWNGTVWVE